MESVGRFKVAVDEDLCDGDCVGLVFSTREGRALQAWAQVELREREVVLRQVALYGVNVGAGDFGASTLRSLVQAVMEHFDVDSIRIEETRRTSGPLHSRAVRTLRFRRRSR